MNYKYFNVVLENLEYLTQHDFTFIDFTSLTRFFRLIKLVNSTRRSVFLTSPEYIQSKYHHSEKLAVYLSFSFFCDLISTGGMPSLISIKPTKYSEFLKVSNILRRRLILQMVLIQNHIIRFSFRIETTLCSINVEILLLLKKFNRIDKVESMFANDINYFYP